MVVLRKRSRVVGASHVILLGLCLTVRPLSGFADDVLFLRAGDDSVFLPNSSETVRSFLSWRTAVHLEEVISFYEERYDRSGKYILVLGGGELGNVLSKSQINELTRRLFLKLLAVSRTPPEQTELRVRYGIGDCQVTTMESTVRLEFGRIKESEQVFSPPSDHACMLDFDTTVRHRDAIRQAFAALGSSSDATATFPSPNVLTLGQLKNRLSDRYTELGAAVTVVSLGRSYFSLTVRNIRREVIKDSSYWERLQVTVFVEQLPDEVKFHWPDASGSIVTVHPGDTEIQLVIDGRYSAGLLAPPESEYVDMEPAFSGQLNEYGRALILALTEVN